MIDRLRNRLICICVGSTAGVLLLIYALICFLSIQQLNSAMDLITDRISENGGTFPDLSEDPPKPPPGGGPTDFLTEETRFSTRFFTVDFDGEGEIASVNMDAVSAVTSDQARQYALAVVEKGRDRGWLEGYRYKLYQTDTGRSVVFVDGNMNRSVSRMTLVSAGIVLTGSLLVIVILIVMLSKRAVKPIAESYEKQRQAEFGLFFSFY